MFNSFGAIYRFTTFGESHGAGIGVVIDGVPAGVEFDEEFLIEELKRRRPGRNRFATPRKESDTPEILSGIFEGKTTGTPIGIWIPNRNQRSRDYSNIKDIFRPAHGDLTYFRKYGVRDYRGGGRSSARETAGRVTAGAVAKMVLREFGIKIRSGVIEIGGVRGKKVDFDHARQSPIFALDPDLEPQWIEIIDRAREEHDSVGGVVKVVIENLPVGLGEPIYYKLDGVLAGAMVGINGVKGVYIGNPDAHRLKGSQNNDQITPTGFETNNSGGVLAGISTGEKVEIEVYFKPTPSIFRPQKSIDTAGNPVMVELKGRHDPIIAVRGSVVAEAMGAVVALDMLLLNATRRLDSLKKIYQ
ncbi:MAG: chorismate synthase [Epsilonproteobacteria bacterium]|nr:chorismate synthase [Campylobacterota bacterium]NPA89382.1 chorismate synthase [Campylobacterota bacterium]